MSRRKTIIVAVCALFAVSVCAAVFFASINPPKDDVSDFDYPSEFFCDCGENHIDFQTDGNCAAYSTAYVLRIFGEQTDGEKIAPEIKRVFGFATAKSIANVFEKHGFSAKTYNGNIDTLKQRLFLGVPIIVFLSVPNDTHYAVVVGYDTQYFYLVDSLPENKNADDARYNRKLTTAEFEKVWKTDTVLPDNIYIVPNLYHAEFISRRKCLTARPKDS